MSINPARVSPMRAMSTRRGRWIASAVAGLAFVGASSLAGPTAVASNDGGRATALQRGLSFYRGKTLTFIAPTAAGSANDLVSRAISTQMGAYLHATINVENIPAGQSFPGQDDLAAANPNGLTIGFLNLSADYQAILTHVAGLNFNPVHEVFLGSHPNSLSLIVTQSSSPYTSFGAVIHALPSPPIKVLVTAGAAAIAAELIFDTFGIHDQLVYYANSSALVQGFLRGDANLIGTGYAELIPELNAGIDRALLVGSYGAIGRANPGYAVLSTVPTVGQWLKKDPPKTAGERRDAKFFQIVQSVPNFELAAAAATPAPEAAALDAAARYAFLQPVVKQLLEQVGNVPGFLSPTTGKIDYLSALKYANQISAEIGG